MDRDWLRYLKLVLGWATPSLVGFSTVWTQAAVAGPGAPRLFDPPAPAPLTFAVPNTIDGPELYARHSSHRSHSSHSSHRSHSSHYSGTGGGYVPAPATPSAPSAAPPSNTQQLAPNSTGKAAPRATQDQAILMAMRVQLELKKLGYYTGTIDGVMGAQTKAALSAFQRDQGLAVTGAMDNATLARLGVGG